MPTGKRNDGGSGLSAEEVDDTLTPIVNELERATIRTPLVNPALRQLASGGVSTARPGREAAFDVISTAMQTIERAMAASRSRAGRALGVRPSQPRAMATGAGDVAAAIAAANAAANAAASAATSAAIAAQAAATVVASMVSGPPSPAPAAGAVEDALVVPPGAVAAEPLRAPQMESPARLARPRMTSGFVTSPLISSPGALASGRMPERQQIRRGAVVRVSFTVTNAIRRPKRGVALQCSHLVSNRGDRIPKEAVTFAPPQLNLAPRGRAVVTATLEVPVGARPGSYTARVSVAHDEGIETILMFDVR